MSHNTWALIKLNKNFNVHIYRRGLTVLIVSLLISVALSVFSFLIYVRQPEPDYYGTSGIAPPVQLTSMMTPNMSSKPLLDPDPPTDDGVKIIPQ